VLIEAGLIRLHPWDEQAHLVLQRRRELISRAATDSAAIEPLRALEDRYKRFQIPLSAGPTLTSEMILHLGVVPFTPVLLYAWRIGDVLELSPPAHRSKELEVDWDELSDLPY
jgi:hypothetical protein